MNGDLRRRRRDETGVGTERIDFGNVGESLTNWSATSESNETASLAAGSNLIISYTQKVLLLCWIVFFCFLLFPLVFYGTDRLVYCQI